MANNKKIFTIEINGLTESSKSVDALIEKINALEKSLKNLGGKGGKLEIPVELKADVKELEKQIKKVTSKGKGVQIDMGDDAEYNKLLADRQKQLAAVNKELGNTKKNVKEYKQETKELVAAEEKARNETKQYANTMQGLKQQLKDLKASVQNIDLGSEEFVKTSQHINTITEYLKELEKMQGTTSRNVGNYGEAIEEAMNKASKEIEDAVADAQRLEKFWSSLEDIARGGGKLSVDSLIGNVNTSELENELYRVRKALDNASIGSDEADGLKRYYDELKRVNDEQKRFRGEVVKADNQLKTQLQRTINGTTYTWENLTAAVGELEDKLYQMAANGEKNTSEFRNIAKAAAELKTQLRQVDYEIDSMAESSKGIEGMVSMTQGFTALAQGSVGISQLFGMDSENAMKGIQMMTALQGIASSMQTIQEQIQKGTTFGKMIENWGSKLLVFTGFIEAARTEWFKLLNGLNQGLSSESLKGLEYITGGDTRMMEQAIGDDTKWLKQNQKVIESSRKLREEYMSLFNLIKKLGGEISHIGIEGLKEGLESLNEKVKIGSANIDASTLDDLKQRYLDFESETEVLTNKMSDRWTAFFTNLKAGWNNWLEGVGIINSGTKQTISLLGVLKGAIKGIGMALKAIPLLLVISLIVELVGWISSLLPKIGEWILGNDKLVKSLNKVETEIDLVNKALDRYNSKLSSLKNSGVIDDIDELALRYEKLQIEILKSAKALQDFVKARKDAKSLEEGTKTDDYTFFGKASDIEDIDDATERLKRFREVYFELQAAVESGNDETGERGKGWWKLDIFNWFTSSDAKSDFGEMQKQVIKDLQYQINNIDLSKGTDEIKRFYELLEDPMYASAIANVENLYPEQEWTQVLKKRLEQVQTMYEQITETAKESAEAELAYNEKLYEERMQRLESENERRRRVRNNLTEAIEDEYERELQALYNAESDEIEAARKQGAEMLKINADKVDVEKAVEEEILSIQKKYRRMEMDMLKKHQEDKLKEVEESEWDITDILRRIRDNRLSAEDESLKKHLQELENERQDAIEDAYKEAEEAAKEGHNLTELYNELVLSINIKYDALVKKEKEQYYQDLLDMYEDYTRAMNEINAQMNADRLDAKSADVDINYNVNQNSSSGSFDFNARYGALINEEKKFNQDRLKLELDYLEEKKKLDEEYASLDKDDATREEQVRYEDALKQLKQYKEDGKATEEEYNDLVEKEEELHQQHLLQISQKYNNDLTTINNQYLNDRKSTISQSLAENASLYQEYSNQVNDIMSNVGQDLNAFGIIDYKKSKADMDKALEVVDEGIAAIDAEIESLERKRKSGQISFIDYKQARQELEATKDELKSQGKSITKMMDDLLKEVCSQWKGLVDSWVSSISSLLDTMNETQMILIDNQLAEIEHQLEIQQEAYDKAEEAAEAHKEKMDSIEDELAEARGSRRQFLIDTLAAQQAAYLEDVAAQQKAEQEKEKLEKKQKALEKKRQEQEKKAKVQQAVINTYMAVSNALAVQPWFVGLALSAVALALGMKNVAAIKSTPIYEDGGVIQGARHSQGGVKVLGGQAEVEGGEFITNRKSTAANLPLLTYINDTKRTVTAEDLVSFFNNGTPTVKSKLTRKFASGGQLPTTDGSEVNKVMAVSDANEGNKMYIVQVTDIINAQKNLEKVQVLSGLVNEK